MIFAAAMMAAGVSATSICFSVKLVGPWSTVPQTNWIRNVRGCSETIASVGENQALEGAEDRGVKPDAPGRPAGDDQGDPSPVSRRLVAIGLTLPAPRLRISLVAKLIHERACDGAYSLDPFQLPKQPRKHSPPPWSRRLSAARDACPSDGASLTQRFARYSAYRVDIKLTAAQSGETAPVHSLPEFGG